MKQKTIGVYEIGWEQCSIVLREGTGGEFYAVPEKNSVPRIKIGADTSEWDKVVGSLLHESFEFVAFRLKCRYDPCGDLSHDHSAFLFVLTHPQLSDCCGKVAEFITRVLPDLANEWKKWRKSKRKTRRRKGGK